jgi:putative hydrolase of the HAD superfamily
MIRYLREKTDFAGPEEAGFIWFDKGGTLSKPVIKDRERGISYYRKIMDILGAEGDPGEFGDELMERDKSYKKWAMKSWVELSENDRCTRFLFPDFPPERVKENSEELTLLFSRSKGVRELRLEALPVIRTLSERGYRVGVISNTISRVLVPGELEEAGLKPFLEGLVMSSLTGIRKPDPALFHIAAETVSVPPGQCVYIGDQPNRDVEGPRRAGYGLNVILKTSNYPVDQDLPELQIPDITIDGLEDLLDLFPARGGI